MFQASTTFSFFNASRFTFANVRGTPLTPHETLNGSKFFLENVSVWAGFCACFFETRSLPACLAFFDPGVFLGISVEDRVLEIVGLDSGSGLIISDLSIPLRI